MIEDLFKFSSSFILYLFPKISPLHTHLFFFYNSFNGFFCQTHKTLPEERACWDLSPKVGTMTSIVGKPGSAAIGKTAESISGRVQPGCRIFHQARVLRLWGARGDAAVETHIWSIFFPWRWSFWKEFGYSPCCRVFADFIWFDFLGNRSALALYILLFWVHSLYSGGIVGNIWAAGESVFTQNLPLELVSNPAEI